MSRIKTVFSLALLMVVAGSSVDAATTTLFTESFDGITSGYTGNRLDGVPVTGTGADQNWYGARFEKPDNGTIVQDVGVQNDGATPVGVVEDDAGLMFRVDTRGYSSISLSFDWSSLLTRTIDDGMVVGYFVGDITQGHPDGTFAIDRTIDLRNQKHFTSGTETSGIYDGAWNWSVDAWGGNTGNWIELMRADSGGVWQTGQTFELTAAADQAEVWVALWLDAGEADLGRIDNVSLTGVSSVPVPAAVWLFGSGLLGMAGIARRGSRKRAASVIAG